MVYNWTEKFFEKDIQSKNEIYKSENSFSKKSAIYILKEAAALGMPIFFLIKIL